VQAAQNEEPKFEDSLPDPRLNPMINPRLGKNLGRWANVYYTSPPEKREQAVLELVRELEGGPMPVRETEPPASSKSEDQTPVQDVPGTQSNFPPRRFCGHCGSSLRKVESRALPERESRSQELSPSAIARLPELENQPPEPSAGNQSEETGTEREKRSSRKQILFVLFVSATIATWSMARIRMNRIPQVAGAGVPVILGSASAAETAVESRGEPGTDSTPDVAPVQPAGDSAPGTAQKLPAVRPVRIRTAASQKAVSMQMVHSPLPRLSKPFAGKPIPCGADHLGNCSVTELYRQTLVLADHIDALYIGYDKRITGLLRQATTHAADTRQQKQSHARQANRSAQLLEHLQLASYANHERYEAVKYQAELIRREAATSAGQRAPSAYQNPQSCLELHYVAADLRKLAANLRRARITTRASGRRPVSTPVAR
jgi:hypothetical protein